MWRRCVVWGVVACSALVLAGSALAATPQQIYRDYADNGRLDHQYSQADLQRAQRDAALQGYPHVGVQGAVQQALGAQGVKASGGIRTLQDVQAMTAAGATRIGASASVKIVEATAA